MQTTYKGQNRWDAGQQRSVTAQDGRRLVFMRYAGGLRLVHQVTTTAEGERTVLVRQRLAPGAHWRTVAPADAPPVSPGAARASGFTAWLTAESTRKDGA